MGVFDIGLILGSVGFPQTRAVSTGTEAEELV